MVVRLELVDPGLLGVITDGVSNVPPDKGAGLRPGGAASGEAGQTAAVTGSTRTGCELEEALTSPGATTNVGRNVASAETNQSPGHDPASDTASAAHEASATAVTSGTTEVTETDVGSLADEDGTCAAPGAASVTATGAAGTASLCGVDEGEEEEGGEEEVGELSHCCVCVEG